MEKYRLVKKLLKAWEMELRQVLQYIIFSILIIFVPQLTSQYSNFVRGKPQRQALNRCNKDLARFTEGSPPARGPAPAESRCPPQVNHFGIEAM